MEKFSPGLHLLVDFWGSEASQSVESIQSAFEKSVAACNATLLNIQLHAFGENSGVTGVAMLAESHMSIHTWPELDYMAIDIFMCGSANPHKAVEELRKFFKPKREKITECKRGVDSAYSLKSDSEYQPPKLIHC